MSTSFIRISGAKEHNLKNISLKIPRNQLTVITGVSGSGKSSLAFDTLYAEGQRRYVESLSSYARQFLENLKKPDVESIDGLSPAIAIEQQGLSHNPRSTVGTLTEIYDYLRLLFARVGHAFCSECNLEIAAQSLDQMVSSIMKSYSDMIYILAPIVRQRKGEYQKDLLLLKQKGYSRVKVDGQYYDLALPLELDKNKKHSMDVLIDRLEPTPKSEERLLRSLETTLRLTNGLVKIEDLNGNEKIFSEKFSCTHCGSQLPEIEPRLFSFNSPMGACVTCHGLGFEGLVSIDSTKDLLMEEIEENEWDTVYFQKVPCSQCQGTRLKKEALSVKIGNRSIGDLVELSLPMLLSFFKDICWSDREKNIAPRILKEITDRLDFLIRVGVGYLTLNRPAATLSGGEGQRIRLATQVGSALTGVLYVLDEPSIGLHPKDNLHLIEALQKLKERRNTVLVVEHDTLTMTHADHIIDMGPGAGIHGGNIIAQGSLSEIKNAPHSLTGAYLAGKCSIDISSPRKPSHRYLTLSGATENNLKNITLKLPLGLFVCITGVSGSGKSSLMIDTLYRALAKKLQGFKGNVGKYKNLEGVDFLEYVHVITQSPIGRTPRSNPATYTGIYSHIRTLFSQLPESKIRGYKPGRFSFNVTGGRCENCMGAGLVKMEMHFLPNSYIECDICQGRRYNRETLEVRYKDKNISEVLEMTVEEALLFFTHVPHIQRKLATLSDVGLGYIHLGQQATTLSGGESQRIKLSKELGKKSTGTTLYILDEPTTGLHFEDIRKLLRVLQKLTDAQNTIVVIEHNLDVIKCADYIIDMGPDAGDAGGTIIAQGTPEEIAKNAQSLTGQFLRKVL
ncbi:MAG: excinuclease ABC subunit UvrA [Deltaproteobacteria bacterium]|nr:excinuclease ABC subunit UvrA [Deltaproteobacteria bacterium]